MAKSVARLLATTLGRIQTSLKNTKSATYVSKGEEQCTVTIYSTVLRALQKFMEAPAYREAYLMVIIENDYKKNSKG